MGYLSSEEILDNRFRLLRHHKEGGQGQVVTAWDELEQCKVAVKFQHPREFLGSATFKDCGENIHLEADLGDRLAGIKGVPLVLHRSPEDAPRAYFVMEYVDGKTLTEFISDYRPIGESAAAAVIGQLCGTLDTVHARGVVHRDVKSDNIIIHTSGDVWLVDAGYATSMGEPTPIGGTWGYAAPEQYVEGAVLTARTDIFGLGCALLEMCLPCRPFAHLDGRPQPGSEAYPGWIPIYMPDSLRDLAFEMIAISESARPGSMRDVHERLSPSLPKTGSAPPAKITDPDPTAWYRSGKDTLF